MENKVKQTEKLHKDQQAQRNGRLEPRKSRLSQLRALACRESWSDEKRMASRVAPL